MDAHARARVRNVDMKYSHAYYYGALHYQEIQECEWAVCERYLSTMGGDQF